MTMLPEALGWWVQNAWLSLFALFGAGIGVGLALRLVDGLRRVERPGEEGLEEWERSDAVESHRGD